ncbi:GntR family transcriptional regulator [Loigolactobacillus backii]|uniref:GntR family transcriptional regulator n=1 Tax=Loigolactobacillus backii TaxID=375175 RepID=A0A192H347_9LACO|nr:GntR family transcriptional regulator [Loigolactobacillus backii]ANK60182.1 GntR family transcriptional regulator [Loigolactobacillus backii]ANK62376.1 GntR family transcriptional regulator [Loigolactobacillus backii]ANK65064.1 GntR family transcriptional regulator [Loigolactobacillus backii]ANK67620.1 GntR family transcriptional regulator [Loigolactobacillus backii]ANK70612.1 GntR family transcriptional regulator [Loigolactobacillus backii]
MKFNDKVPIYYQIKQYVYQEIILGHLKAGQKLPAIRQLAVTLTVNVNTIQRALSELTTEGIIITQRGKGNFVTSDTQLLQALKKRIVTEQFSELYDKMLALKITPAEMVQYLKNYIDQRKEVQHD